MDIGDLATWISGLSTFGVAVAAWKVSKRVYELEKSRDGEQKRIRDNQAAVFATMLAHELAMVHSTLSILGGLTLDGGPDFNPNRGLNAYLEAKRRLDLPLLERLADKLDVMPPGAATKLGIVLTGASLSVRNQLPFTSIAHVPDEIAREACRMLHGEAKALLRRVYEAELSMVEVARMVATIPTPEELPAWARPTTAKPSY